MLFGKLLTVTSPFSNYSILGYYHGLVQKGVITILIWIKPTRWNHSSLKTRFLE